jgi:hypothetical protein
VTRAPHCAIVTANAHPRWRWAVALRLAFARDGTPVIRLDRALCKGGVCETAWRGVPLYRDTGRLSATGSILLGKRTWRDARLVSSPGRQSF